jgi:hypothetical protein
MESLSITLNSSHKDLSELQLTAQSGVFNAMGSAGHYWAARGANREADKASSNVRHSFTLAAGSQLMPNRQFAFYEGVSFRRTSCLINLPSHINRNDPKLNGLVDR